MSFGRPPSLSSIRGDPPQRGSFPLDHDGECKQFMTAYMKCLRANSGQSTPCRLLNRQYLDCRMQNGLMDKDEWVNLGLSNLKEDRETAKTSETAAPASKSKPAGDGLPTGKS